MSVIDQQKLSHERKSRQFLPKLDSDVPAALKIILTTDQFVSSTYVNSSPGLCPTVGSS